METFVKLCSGVLQAEEVEGDTYVRVRIGVACVAQGCRCLCTRCSRGIGGMFLHENFII